MSEKRIVDGLLFYSSIYVNTILLFVAFITNRWIFLLFILFTLGLTVYMMYVASEHMEHIKKIGKWAQDTIHAQIDKVKALIYGAAKGSGT